MSKGVEKGHRGDMLSTTGHTTFNTTQQSNLEGWIQKTMASGLEGFPKQEVRDVRAWKQAVSEAPSSRPVSPWLPDVASQMIKKSRLVQIAEARRRVTEEDLGAKFDCPRQLHRLPTAAARAFQRQPTPPRDDPEGWAVAARGLDKSAVVRIVHSLQVQLERERDRREAAEAKLAARRGTSAYSEAEEPLGGRGGTAGSRRLATASRLGTGRSLSTPMLQQQQHFAPPTTASQSVHREAAMRRATPAVRRSTPHLA